MDVVRLALLHSIADMFLLRMVGLTASHAMSIIACAVLDHGLLRQDLQHAHDGFDGDEFMDTAP